MVFYDAPTYTHLIAAEIKTTVPDSLIYTGLYRGFIYQFCALNYPVTAMDTDVTTPACDGDFCTECSAPDTCLTDCEFNEHLSNLTRIQLRR